MTSSKKSPETVLILVLEVLMTLSAVEILLRDIK